MLIFNAYLTPFILVLAIMETTLIQMAMFPYVGCR